MRLVVHVDGGARGNPGPAGAGVVIREENGGLVHEAGYFLGRQTNNAAEYHALIRALQRAQRCSLQAITIHSDSELLVRQLTGEYGVRNAKLAVLHQQVQLLLIKSPRWIVRHVRREENARADELANMAMDQQRDVVVFDIDGTPPATAPSSLPPPPAAEPAQPDESRPECRSAPAPKGTTGPTIHVTVQREPEGAQCPAGGLPASAFTVGHTLPAGMCLHAAQAMLPTLLAMLNTAPEEFASVPTLTVRCGRVGCPAVFLISPQSGTNGTPPAKR